MLTRYEPSMPMRDALARYFEVNQFGEDGGYDDAWVDFKLGPIPFPFPNSSSRKRAVKVHDLHHIVTGYDTDTRGEFEISAWEIGAGCKDSFAAWQLNLSAMGAGVLVAPSRTYRAFVRGLHSDSLYGSDVDALMPKTVREVREVTGAEQASSAQATLGDKARFLAAGVAGVAAMLAFGAMFVPLVPVGLAASWWRKTHADHSGSRGMSALS